MVQIINPSPRAMQAGQIGQALGLGVGQNLARQQQQKQQSILANLLFGNQGQQFAGLPMEAQLEAAKLQTAQQSAQQKQLAQERKSQLIQTIFGQGLQSESINEEMQGLGTSTPTQPRELSNSELAALAMEDPQLARILQQQQESKRKETSKKEEGVRRERLEFHKESQKFDEKLTESAEAASKKIEAINRQEKILPKLTKKDRVVSALFNGTKFENLLKSKDAQEFDASILPMIEGMRQLFGVRLSDADLRLVLQKIATSEKDPEAIKSILGWQKLEAKLDIERRKIADEIRKSNKGLRPLDFQDQIRKRMDERFGKEIDETARQIMSLRDDKEDAAKFIERVKVPQGTKLNTEAIDLYLKLANDDIEKAKEMAKEDGYEF